MSLTFEQWLEKLDKIFIRKTGLSYQDFEDYHWMGCFEDEMTPNEAFKEFMEENYNEYL